jgi:hypothetical protein
MRTPRRPARQLQYAHMNLTDHAAPLQSALDHIQTKAVARDALAFVGLATAVALGIAAVLGALVLLLAAPAEATPAVGFKPAPLPQSAVPGEAPCGSALYATATYGAAGSSERCHYLMQIPNVLESVTAPALLHVRAARAVSETSS